jgi:hypothetical protein
MGFVNPWTATLPTAVYYFHLYTILRYKFVMNWTKFGFGNYLYEHEKTRKT